MANQALCDNCKGNVYKVFLDGITSWEHPGKFRIVTCKTCHLAYLHPRPQRGEMSSFYPSESYWGEDREKDVPDSGWKTTRDKNYNFLYHVIFAKKEKGTILDIGAGTGVFLTKFKEKHWETRGIELSKSAAAFGKKTFGMKLLVGDLLDYRFPEKKFDVVTFNNALEHLYNPSATLKKIHPILKNNGILIITVPNINSFGFKMFRKEWYPLQPPRHLYHFSPKTLTDMLNNCGFFVTKIDHRYMVHNYYSLFESFRFFFSPRFAKKAGGGLVQSTVKKGFSAKVAIGKAIGKLFSYITAHIGVLLQRGEVITVYAQKKT